MISVLKPSTECFRRLERLPVSDRQELLRKAETLNNEMHLAILEHERQLGLAWLPDAVGVDVIPKVASVVCYIYGIDFDDFRSHNRKRLYVDARKTFSHILRTNQPFTYTQIANYIGRDHTTIIHYMDCAEYLLVIDKHFKSQYMLILDTLKKHYNHQ